tara:strand:+ start:2505 stop:2810 length:306 start_codon:yes stop_codon:yes gene_type:complete
MAFKTFNIPRISEIKLLKPPLKINPKKINKKRKINIKKNKQKKKNLNNLAKSHKNLPKKTVSYKIQLPSPTFNYYNSDQIRKRISRINKKISSNSIILKKK